MSLIMNGTEVRDVVFNGTVCDRVYMNNTLVFQRAYDATQTISGDIQNFHLNNHLMAQGWDGVKPLTGTITVNAQIGSNNTAFAAFFILELPTGTDLTINIGSSGFICGAGGDGASFQPFTNGYPGGDGLHVAPQPAGVVIRVNNSGWIGGGGGGGGSASQSGIDAGGGGGAGKSPGAGGYPGGHPGTLTAGGNGSAPIIDLGGQGGARGAPGARGSSIPNIVFVSEGGAAGRAVVGNNRITWGTVGTIYGARVNS